MAARCLPARKPGRCHQAPRRPRCPARPASAFRARRSPTPAHLARTATCTDARWRSGSGCIRVQQDRADAAGLDVAAGSPARRRSARAAAAPSALPPCPRG
ncbi:hypothetical protein G6F50_016186 [Rhizopus delemar]|uniref:Uncharacterized protein n=1 Tax=Rhizopus delemar TaxID=936053 RepID=A0A9P6XU28_9FUNG|nr:hypothetical protein G6F50_016186 [Rhizopus delemar]